MGASRWRTVRDSTPRWVTRSKHEARRIRQVIARAPGLWIGLVGAVAVVGLTVLLLQFDESALYATALGVLPFGVWFALRRTLNPFYLSPVSIVALFFAALGVLGYTFRDAFTEAGGASIALQLTDEVAMQTLGLISATATIILISSALTLTIMTGVNRRLPARPTGRLEWTSNRVHPLLVIAAALPLIAFVWEVGLADFIQRDYYIVGERGSFLASVVTQLATLVIVLIGYMLANGRGFTRASSLVLLVGYSLLLASFGSRRFALIPILLALGFFLARNTTSTRRGLVLGGIGTLILLPLPLEFRTNQTHGLVPYADTLSKLDWSQIDWLGAVNNILVAFPIIGETAYGRTQIYASDLLISLNPIPGADAGWYDIYERLRLNFYTPTAGIGEVGHVGWGAVLLVFVGVGIVLAWLEVSIRYSVAKGNMMYVGVLIGLVALFALQMAQYNLRQASRVLVYAVALEIGRRVLGLFRKREDSVARTGEVLRAPRASRSSPLTRA